MHTNLHCTFNAQATLLKSGSDRIVDDGHGSLSPVTRKIRARPRGILGSTIGGGELALRRLVAGRPTGSLWGWDSRRAI